MWICAFPVVVELVIKHIHSIYGLTWLWSDPAHPIILFYTIIPTWAINNDPWVGGPLKFTSITADTDTEDSQLLVTVVYEVVLHLNRCPLEELKNEHKIKIYVT